MYSLLTLLCCLNDLEPLTRSLGILLPFQNKDSDVANLLDSF